MNRERRELSTADVARTDYEGRGRGDEQVVSRAELDAEDVRANPPAVDRPIDSDREPTTRDVRPRDAVSRSPQNESRALLVPDGETERLRSRWSDIQGTFVDAPRQAVESADALVAEVMKRMAEVFAAERSNLERQWDRGDKVTTEDLRVALQRYRAFFDRLLTV